MQFCAFLRNDNNKMFGIFTAMNIAINLTQCDAVLFDKYFPSFKCTSASIFPEGGQVNCCDIQSSDRDKYRNLIFLDVTPYSLVLVKPLLPLSLKLTTSLLMRL
jgi:hypothetical protein